MIRKVDQKDIPALFALEVATQVVPWPRETFTKCLEVGYSGWVMEKDSHILGFILVAIQVGEGHVLNLCVDPHHQRQGIATQLLDHTFRIARQQNTGVFYLEVRSSNEKAIALYRKTGFTQIGVRHDYYPTAMGREDALVFAKDIGDFSEIL